MLRRFARALSATVCLLCLLLPAVPLLAQNLDATLTRAKQLIDSKQSQAAFDLLDPLEYDRAGDPDFDYLLGVAAIDSGKFTRGVFALERVIAIKPDHPQARAEIARAYFLMGENRAAKQEFEAVKAQNPPPAVVATIDQFLDSLAAREAGRNATGLNGYVEMGYGYDTNANAATTTGSFAIPAFGGTVFTLNGTGTQTHDWYRMVNAGISGRYRIDAEWALLGSATISERWNEHFDRFDTGFITADGGATWRRGDHEVTGLLQTQESRVDNNPFRRANGGTLQYRYNLTADSQGSAYFQHARLVYPGQRTRDALRDVGGVAYAKVFTGSLVPSIFASVYGGNEIETHTGFGFFGHRVTGLRLGGQISITNKFIVFANGSYEDRRYRAPDPLFLDTRHDRQSDIRIGANYVIAGNWTLTPSVSWTDNRSNIIINDYTRWLSQVVLRYDFR